MLAHCCRALHCELQARVDYVLFRGSLTMPGEEKESRQHCLPSHMSPSHPTLTAILEAKSEVGRMGMVPGLPPANLDSRLF